MNEDESLVPCNHLVYPLMQGWKINYGFISSAF